MRQILVSIVLALGLGSAASAQKIDADLGDYVRANTIFLLYHELGHALIDLLRLPVYGQEEDAADVLGVVLSELINDEDDNQYIMLAAADNFAKMAEKAASEGYEAALWDTHGQDLQRYYTILCLHYGADPEGRNHIALEQDLPEERRETCAEEYTLAEESWGPVLEEIAVAQGGSSWLKLSIADQPRGAAEAAVMDAVANEVKLLNDVFAADKPLEVVFGQCGEANAFYNSEDSQMIICAELGEMFSGMKPSARAPDETRNKG